MSGQLSFEPVRHLSGGRLDISVVLNSEVAGLPFFVERKLTGLTTSKFVLVPATLNFNSRETGPKRDFNKDNRVTQVTPSSFEHHRRVEDNELDAGVGAVDLCCELPPNFGVNDLIKLSEGLNLLRRIAEHSSGQSPTIDVRCVEDVFAKSGPYSVFHGGKGEDLVADSIRIDDSRAEVVREAASHRALTGTDAANNADHEGLRSGRHAGREVTEESAGDSDNPL